MGHHNIRILLTHMHNQPGLSIHTLLLKLINSTREHIRQLKIIIIESHLLYIAVKLRVLHVIDNDNNSRN